MPDTYCLADDIIQEFRKRKLKPDSIISLLSKLNEDTKDRNTWNRCTNKSKHGVSRDQFKRLCEAINLHTKWGLTYARFCCEKRRADFLHQEKDALAEDHAFWKSLFSESEWESLGNQTPKKFSFEKSVKPGSAGGPPDQSDGQSRTNPPTAAPGTRRPDKRRVKPGQRSSKRSKERADAEPQVDPCYMDTEERELPPRQRKKKDREKNGTSGVTNAHTRKSPPNKLVIGSILGGITLLVILVVVINHLSDSSAGPDVVAGEPERGVKTPPVPDSPAPSTEKTVELVLETQRQTIAQIQKRLPQVYQQLVETEITGFSESEQQEFLQHTSRSRPVLTSDDVVYQPAAPDGSSLTHPVTLRVNGDLDDEKCFWYRIDADGIGRMVPGSFGKQQITLGGRGRSYRLLLVVLAPDAPPPAISVAMSRAPVLLVPAYFYPDSDVALSEYWDQFRRMKEAVRGQAQLCVVLNIFNGSGKMDPVTGDTKKYPDTNYINLIAELDKKDIPWLAYLTRMQGKPRLISLQDDFQAWKDEYPSMAGVFIDDVESDERGVNGLRDFCRHVRASFAASGNTAPILLANCGVPCNTDLTAPDMFNWVCIDETTVAKSRFARPASSPNQVRYGALLHSAESDGQVRERMQELLADGADFLFLTDEVYTNEKGVWKMMPTDSIVDAMASVLKEQRLPISHPSLVSN